MTRALFALFFTVLTGCASKPWPGAKFAEVRAFAWPDDKETRQVILPGMKLKPGVINQEGAKLSPEQTSKLVAAVTGTHPEYVMLFCHTPHNAFVFYDNKHKPVAFLEICFACGSEVASPKVEATYIDLPALAAIFDSHKLPMGMYPNLAAFPKGFRDLAK